MAILSATTIQYFQILLPLALILTSTKLLSILCKKIGLPQVVGMLVSGILLGLIRLAPNQRIFTDNTLEGLAFLAKIGVILIMFSAGIETDLKQFKTCGLPSVIITALGVIFPVGLGFIVASAFNGGFANMTRDMLVQNFFYGTILAATSVSVTVATLKEMGKLSSKVGMSIIAAAILDDIIGVILLSLLIGIKNGDASNIGIVIGKMFGFFAAAGVLGIIIHFVMQWVERRWPHTRRLPIFGFAICFFMAYAAEKWFGVADITGAYIAGIIMATVKEHDYIDRKIDVSNYMIFAPVFFANIGITANYGNVRPEVIGFGFAFIAAGLIGKVIGCGGGALLCKYSFKDSFRVGIGMMVRAEVVLVCTQKGVDSGIIDSSIMPFVLILIIVSTLLTPLLLKLSYRKENKMEALLRAENTPAISPALATASSQHCEVCLPAGCSIDDNKQ